MSDDRQHSKAFQGVLLLGSSSAAQILFGVVRMKLAAVVLGVGGVGILGLLQGAISAIAAVSTAGLNTLSSGRIASADGSSIETDARVIAIGYVLVSGLLGVLAAAFIFIYHEKLIGSAIAPAGTPIGPLLLGVAVFASTLAVVCAAIISGFKQVRMLAAATIVSTGLSTILVAIALARPTALTPLICVVVPPSMQLVVMLTSMLRLCSYGGLPFTAIVGSVVTVIRGLPNGILYTISAGTVMIGQLIARSHIFHQAGPDAAGLFQAAANVSIAYLGVVFSSLSADFYPTLSSLIHQPIHACKQVNAQIEITFLIAAPIICALYTAAPLVCQVLYSDSFLPAADILRVMAVGDALKVFSLPLTIVLMATNRHLVYTVITVLSTGIFVGGIWIALPVTGTIAAAISYVAMQSVLLALVLGAAIRAIGYTPSISVLRYFIVTVVTALALCIVGSYSETGVVALGGTATVFAAIYGVAKTAELTDASGIHGMIGRRFKALLLCLRIRVTEEREV